LFWRPYGIDQTDLALRRRFNLTERLKLDVRAEYFNVFNHIPCSAPPVQPTKHGVWGVRLWKSRYHDE
jgi:hypothetical protein